MLDPIEGAADDLEAAAASFVRENRLPGAAVGVIHDKGLAWFGGIGFAGRRRTTSAGADDLVPDRLHHEDVHGNRNHAASRRRSTPSR
jgi:hypothetical protein